MKSEETTIVIAPGDIEPVMAEADAALPVDARAKADPSGKGGSVAGMRVFEIIMAAIVVLAVAVGLISSIRDKGRQGGNPGIVVGQEEFVNFAPNAPNAVCPFGEAILDVRGDGSLLMRQVVDKDTVTVQLAYDDEGWVGFAFSESGSMVPNVAVIGLPDAGTVLKYNLGGRSEAAVTPLGQSSQTLSDASIIQQDGKTVLTFSKPRFENGEVSVSPGGTQFLWALGGGNNLVRHAERGSASFDFTSCIGENEGDVVEIGTEEPVENKVTAAPTTYPTKTPTSIPTTAPTKAPKTAEPSQSPTTAEPSQSPTTAEPSQSPTKNPITGVPTSENPGQYIDFPDQEQAYSKIGNRRSCNFDSCPSGPWAEPTNLGAGCQCTNNLNSCYWNGSPTVIEYYPQIELVRTQWSGVYKMQATGLQLEFGRGGDTASGVDCFEDPLKGGFKVDLWNTGYAFDRRSWVRMSGTSPSMKIWADNTVYEDRRYGVSGAQLEWNIPAATQSLEVVCGGWPAECWSDLYVYKL